MNRQNITGITWSEARKSEIAKIIDRNYTSFVQELGSAKRIATSWVAALAAGGKNINSNGGRRVKDHQRNE